MNYTWIVTGRLISFTMTRHAAIMEMHLRNVKVTELHYYADGTIELITTFTKSK